MNSDPLDDLLHAYAKQPLALSHSNLKTGVWRRIETVRSRMLGWRFALRDLLLGPRIALAGLAVALVVGIVPAVTARAMDQSSIARTSLHLDVFSTRSPGTPAALLSGRR